MSGQRDDGDAIAILAGAQLASDLQPGAAGEEEIEDDHVGGLLRGDRDRLRRIARLAGIDAVACEARDEHPARDRVVVDDQDAQAAVLARVQHSHQTAIAAGVGGKALPVTAGTAGGEHSSGPPRSALLRSARVERPRGWATFAECAWSSPAGGGFSGAPSSPAPPPPG